MRLLRMAAIRSWDGAGAFGRFFSRSEGHKE
jgi:hypothetical protein